MRDKTIVVALAAAACGVFAGPASAALPGGFVPFKSVGGARLGMSKQALFAKLGPPTSGDNGQQVQYYEAPSTQMLITFNLNRPGQPIASIQASGAIYRNSHGFGIGSSRATVRHRYPHFKYYRHSCFGKRGKHGHLTMDLDFTHHRVSLITLGDSRLSPLLHP